MKKWFNFIIGCLLLAIVIIGGIIFWNNFSSKDKIIGISLDDKYLELTIGESYYLNYSVGNNFDGDVIWTSSDASVVYVLNGVVKAKKVGTAIITVSTPYSKETSSCIIKVYDSVIMATKITLDKNDIKMEVGDSHNLKYTIMPINATNKKVSFKSSNPKVVTVSEKGVLKAKGVGEALITVSLDGTNLSTTCRVTVSSSVVEVNDVSFEQSLIELYINDTYNFKYTITPSNATNQEVIFVSSNPKVATVSTTGVLKALSKGETLVTIKTLDGSKSDVCRVVVNERTISILKIDLSQTSANLTIGQTINLKVAITPSNATNQELVWSTSDTNVVTVSQTGQIKAVGVGNATIMVKAKNTNVFQTCNVTVREQINQIHFIKQRAGSADAILLKSGSSYGMIDTGNENVEDNNAIINYLKNNQVTTLDFMLITHNHDDHAGGALAILNSGIQVKKIYIKTYICKDNRCGNASKNRYNNLINLANAMQIPISYIEQNFSDGGGFSLGEMNIKLYNTVQRMNDSNYRGSSENYNSVVQYITVKGYKTMLTADSYSWSILNAIIDQVGSVDVYKIPHHGYATCATNKDTANKVNAKHLIVTNTYGAVGVNNGSGSCIKNFDRNTPIYYVNDMTNSVIVNYSSSGITVNKN